MAFQQQFFQAIKQMEDKIGGEERFYVVRCQKGDFYGVPMNIIYSARNPYGVWLKAYEYIRSKNPYVADKYFYSEERILRKSYDIVSAVSSEFYSFIHGNTLWCEEW